MSGRDFEATTTVGIASLRR